MKCSIVFNPDPAFFYNTIFFVLFYLFLEPQFCVLPVLFSHGGEQYITFIILSDIKTLFQPHLCCVLHKTSFCLLHPCGLLSKLTPYEPYQGSLELSVSKQSEQ